MKKAFILGAGLGNRLRPLTGRLPKPLVPLFHRSLAEWAIEACKACGINQFAINTHHLPDCWKSDDWGDNVTFFHEEDLLETGGGLKNIASWIGNESILVHNGDIFSTLPLERLILAHEASGQLVTLALRSEGDAKHIALDSSGTRVIDIRNRHGVKDGTHVFTGIYCIRPEFLEMIPPGEKISVIPAFLELAQRGQLGAVTLDEGVWLDLGDRETYLQAHLDLKLGAAIHAKAIIEEGAQIERSVIGTGAKIEARAVVRDSVIWPNALVKGTAILDRCIVFSTEATSGTHSGADL